MWLSLVPTFGLPVLIEFKLTSLELLYLKKTLNSHMLNWNIIFPMYSIMYKLTISECIWSLRIPNGSVPSVTMLAWSYTRWKALFFKDINQICKKCCLDIILSSLHHWLLFGSVHSFFGSHQSTNRWWQSCTVSTGSNQYQRRPDVCGWHVCISSGGTAIINS